MGDGTGTDRFPLSVTIIAANEEANIAECLESVSWVDEIIVVDSGSNDRTKEVASRCTLHVVSHPWEGYARQKTFGLSLATHEWVLSLDADERVSPELKAEISSLDFSKADGFFIPRRNFFLDRVIRTCGWSPDYQLRLFRKSVTHVTGRKVHERFVVEGRTSRLRGELLHFTHPTVEGTLRKINEYSTLRAAEKSMRKHPSGITLVLHPLWEFLHHYILRRGFVEGVHGLMVSLIHAMTDAQTYMKIWELQNVKRNRQKSPEPPHPSV
ncbi:MAG: hypothetical protein COS95_01035 [Ignavibacteriales bacterium CG07_land_8_20_14_0_80_59_12]|nr:MAG: hypothetical protein COS95_01035 [Ignavibacteriales bacterium CG07_land_8_20_14_0_80_59_12]